MIKEVSERIFEKNIKRHENPSSSRRADISKTLLDGLAERYNSVNIPFLLSVLSLN